MNLLPGVRSGAYPPDGEYRYALSRDWVDEPDKVWGNVLWIMLNPSTATAEEDDPTIRRCQSFSRAWGYDGIAVGNLFGLRSTDPKALKKHKDPVGPGNNAMLEFYFADNNIGLAVAAWGTNGSLLGRDLEVARMAKAAGRDLLCLGTTMGGSPRHPLYVGGETPPEEYIDRRLGFDRA